VASVVGRLGEEACQEETRHARDTVTVMGQLMGQLMGKLTGQLIGQQLQTERMEETSNKHGGCETKERQQLERGCNGLELLELNNGPMKMSKTTLCSTSAAG